MARVHVCLERPTRQTEWYDWDSYVLTVDKTESRANCTSQVK